MKHAVNFENIFSLYLVKDRSVLSRYLGSLGFLFFSFGLIIVLQNYEISRMYSLTLLAITFAAVHGGIGPAILCSMIGAVVVNGYTRVFQFQPDVLFILTSAFWIRVLIYSITSFVVAFLICEIKKIYKVAQEARNIAESANTQKDKLIRIIAHDLRNPIGVVMGYSDLLNIKSQSAEAVREIAQKISATSMELTLLIDDLLSDQSTESAVHHEKNEPVRIDRLLSTVVDVQSVYAARKGIIIKFGGLTEKHPRVAVKGDVRKIARIFQNLIDNAVKYSPVNSEIKVDMNVMFQRVHIRFIDKGPGIHPDDVAKLFKPWSRTRNQTTTGESSTGLGLSICKDLATSMGGTIEFSNLYPTGSVFTLRLPVYIELTKVKELKLSNDFKQKEHVTLAREL